jgi:hypothetical protein
MNLQDLSKPLSIDQIDFRIQSINLGGYATILAYKDARVDMQRLDDVCGPLNWKREHVRDNKNCIISIWDDENKQWVGKEDTGVESNTEKEKGLASDSFKRAGFNWGIGRELYDYPLIQIKLNSDEFAKKTVQGKERASATWNLKLREWQWVSQFKEDILVFLQAKDNHNKVRFTWGKGEKLPSDKKFEDDGELLSKYTDAIDKLGSADEVLSYAEKIWKQANKELSKPDMLKLKSYRDQMVDVWNKDVVTRIGPGEDIPL